jgi:hypothetical protein
MPASRDAMASVTPRADDSAQTDERSRLASCRLRSLCGDAGTLGSGFNAVSIQPLKAKGRMETQ